VGSAQTVWLIRIFALDLSRSKQKKFAEMQNMPHVLQFPHGMAGKWAAHFGNTNPIVFEIGCGRGTYTVALAQRYPEKNFVGVDIKGSRMWHGAMQVQGMGLKNAAFLRTRVEQLGEFLAQSEASEFWITFPDPHPREGEARKRLTAPRFLNLYRSVGKVGAIVHLKTDNQMLHEFTMWVLQQNNVAPQLHTADLYAHPNLIEADLLDIQTQYESKFLGEGLPITYLRFALPNHDFLPLPKKVTPAEDRNEEEE